MRNMASDLSLELTVYTIQKQILYILVQKGKIEAKAEIKFRKKRLDSDFAFRIDRLIGKQSSFMFSYYSLVSSPLIN